MILEKGRKEICISDKASFGLFHFRYQTTQDPTKVVVAKWYNHS